MNSVKKPRVAPFYIACLMVGIICLAWNVESYDRNILTAPRSPDATSGKVIAYNNHGTTVYLTKKQDLIERWGPCGWLVWWVESR